MTNSILFQLPDQRDLSYILNCKLSSNDIKALQRYVSSNKVGVQDAHSVLVHMITGVSIDYSADAPYELPPNIQVYLAMTAQVSQSYHILSGCDISCISAAGLQKHHLSRLVSFINWFAILISEFLRSASRSICK